MLKELLKLSNGKKLDVKFPIELFDSKGNKTYWEDSTGFWSKREFNSNGKCTYYEDSTGYCSKSEYDTNGNEKYYENSDGKIRGTKRYCSKSEYDSNGNNTYFEYSTGYWCKREFNSWSIYSLQTTGT